MFIFAPRGRLAAARSAHQTGCSQAQQGRRKRQPYRLAALSISGRLVRLGLAHDPEKCEAVLPREKRGTRLRGDHAQTKN